MEAFGCVGILYSTQNLDLREDKQVDPPQFRFLHPYGVDSRTLRWTYFLDPPRGVGSIWTSKVPKTMAQYPRIREYRQYRTHYFPEGPSTQYLRTLVPKTIPSMVFGTRVLKYWVLGPSGFVWVYTAEPLDRLRLLLERSPKSEAVSQHHPRPRRSLRRDFLWAPRKPLGFLSRIPLKGI